MLTNLKEKQEKRKSHYCSFFFPLLFCRLMHGLVTHYLSWKCNYYIVQPTTNYNCRKRNYYFFWVHNKHSIFKIEIIHSHILIPKCFQVLFACILSKICNILCKTLNSQALLQIVLVLCFTVKNFVDDSYQLVTHFLDFSLWENRIAYFT